MERTIIKNLKKGEISLIKGWMEQFRDLGNVAFLKVRDRSGIVQVVLEEKSLIGKISECHIGSVMEIEGEVVEQKNGQIELINPSVKILSKVIEVAPIQFQVKDLKENLETLLDHRALSLRHERYRAIFKIQAGLVKAYRDFMTVQECTEYFGPAMTASSSEGGAEVFKLPYFEGQATLAQSNQLYKQIMVGAYERVFALAKWFRAENSNTRRHLTEGFQFEFEMGFIEDFNDVMNMLDSALKFMIKTLHENFEVELKSLNYKAIMIPESQFPRIKFLEACEIVREKTGQDTSDWDDLTTEAERILCDYARAEYGSDFIFVTEFKKGVFYAYKNAAGVYQNFDLLCREAEIVSGGQRIHDYENLKNSIEKAGMNPDTFSEYLSIFKNGMPPHGGFGMGLERLTMLLLGIENIREASLFPSDPKRVASQHI